MPTNDFLPFATAPGANVADQATWNGLAARTAGFSAGVASSAQVNKALRQANFIAAAVAQFTADLQAGNVLDDGVIANFENQFKAAIIAQAATAFTGARLIASTGYQKLPGGLILQWFRNVTTTTNSGGYATFNLVFPVTFTSAVLGSAFYPVNESSNNTTATQTLIGSPAPTFSGLSVNLSGGTPSAPVAISGFVIGV